MKSVKHNLILCNSKECVVIEHTTKIAEAFERKGLEVVANMGMIADSKELQEEARKVHKENWLGEWGVNDYTVTKGDKRITIKTVYRRNGTGQNVSTRITILQTPHGENIEGYWGGILNRIYEAKILKDAGERAINNKINKALEVF